MKTKLSLIPMLVIMSATMSSAGIIPFVEWWNDRPMANIPLNPSGSVLFLDGSTAKKAANSQFAHTQGNETLYGIKTFASGIVGNSRTATSLLNTGTSCPTGQAPSGVTAFGNSTGCFTPDGTYTEQFTGPIQYEVNGVLIPGPSTMAAACAQSYPIHVTSALSAVQSNISSATVHSCGAQIFYHPGGRINNTTTLRISEPFTAGTYQIFGGTGRIIFTNTSVNPNPQWWGAVGDATTDNGVALQRAFTSCNDSHILKMTLPTGIYYTTTAINAYTVKLYGEGIPTLPFMDRADTVPGSTTNKYSTYKTQCTGSVITTGQAISVFSHGLYADGIGIFGDIQAAGGNGISHTDGGQPIFLNNCKISGFKEHAIYAPYGLIFGTIENSVIFQNGGSAIYIGNTVGTYTGETNKLIIRNNIIMYNEKNAIYGLIKGRSISIKENDFTGTGNAGQTGGSQPTTSANVVYAVDLTFYNSGGYTNGAVAIIDNYSEGSYGLVRLSASDPVYGVTVSTNQFKPNDDTYYTCVVDLSGYMTGIQIRSNDFYTIYDYLKLESGNLITVLDTDLPITGTLAYSAPYPSVELKSVGETNTSVGSTLGSFVNIYSNVASVVHTFTTANMITGMTYTGGNTNVALNTSLSGSYDFGVDGVYNKNVGYALRIESSAGSGIMAFVGIIQSYTLATTTWVIKGDRHLLYAAGAKCDIVRLPGFNTINGAGAPAKLVVDWDGTISAIGK